MGEGNTKRFAVDKRFVSTCNSIFAIVDFRRTGDPLAWNFLPPFAPRHEGTHLTPLRNSLSSQNFGAKTFREGKSDL